MIRLTILVFILAGFVLGAMRSMAQQDSCLLPPAERPDYCTGNAPTITPSPAAPAQATLTPSTYPAPIPYPASLQPRSGRQGLNPRARTGGSLNSFLKTTLDFCNDSLASPAKGGARLDHKYKFYCEVIHGLYP